MDYNEECINADDYIIRYLALLAERGKSPQEVADALPEGAVLLCYEKPTDFCHRHIAAEWLRGADVTINELPKP